MPLEVAAHAGFCMGVRRAVEVAMKVADTDVPSCTLGALIHNPTVVEMLRAHGIPAISTPEEAAGRQVLIRSHGVSPQVLAELEEHGCSVLDLTCPFVDRLHRIVSQGTADGTPVIMVGEKDHPEVMGTCGWAKGEVYVVATPEEAARLAEVREALMQIRIFPEKVIKYLWDDAFKFNPEALFDTDNMDSLEKVIRTFVLSQGRDRFKVFRSSVQQKLYPSQQ